MGTAGGLTPRAWPFVGRHEELAALLASVQSPETGGVVLGGAAGVGKTSLARALRDAARDRGWATEEVAATRAAASIPLGAFAHVLPDVQAPGTVLVDVLAKAAAALVARAEEGERLVLTVDDAHLLDDASAALLHRLARAPEVFVVATVRSREPAPDAVVALWKDELAVRIDVDPLGFDEIEAMVSAALGGQPSRALVHRVLEVSAGNPLAARELLLSGLESGSLSETNGVWNWHGPIAGRRLQEFVEARLERLSEEERAALQVIAFGEPLGVAIVESIVGVEVVDALERHELVNVQREARRVLVRISHPMYAEALRAGTPPRQAAAAQRKLADAVAAVGTRRREDRLRVALWRLDGGGPQDAQALLEAAVEADAAFDHVLAGRLAEAARTEGGTEADHILARALWHQGRGDEAEAVWADLTMRVTEENERVEVAAVRSNNLFFTCGRPADADRVLDEAEAGVESPTARLPLLVQRSVYALYGARPVDALFQARAALDHTGVSNRAMVQATVIGGPALAITGRADDAVTLVDEALPFAMGLPGADATQLSGQLLAARFLALSLGGRLHEAAELAATVHQLAIEHSSHDGMATMAVAAGQVALALGRPRTAIRWLREAASLLRVHDRIGFLPFCLGELAAAASIVGDLDEAEAALAEADATRHPSLRLFDVELAIGRAWRAAVSGERTLAFTILSEAASWARGTGQAVFEGLALHAAARLGYAAEVADRLEVVAGTVDSREVRLAARHARAIVAGDGAELESVSTGFEEMGALLRAAEAAADAAVAHRAAGRGRPAAGAAERSARLAAQCEGARTPALAGAGGSSEVTTLTRREQEVALLAAQGIPSKGIAERLFLSVRTVDNHLQRAYTKLGVSSRKELAERLAE